MTCGLRKPVGIQNPPETARNEMLSFSALSAFLREPEFSVKDSLFKRVVASRNP